MGEISPKNEGCRFPWNIWNTLFIEGVWSLLPLQGIDASIFEDETSFSTGRNLFDWDIKSGLKGWGSVEEFPPNWIDIIRNAPIISQGVLVGFGFVIQISSTFFGGFTVMFFFTPKVGVQRF